MVVERVEPKAGGSSLTGAQEASQPCARAACTAARLGEQHCIAHVDEPELRGAVNRWRSGGPLDASDAQIDEATLARFLDALAHVEIASKAVAASTRLRPSSCGEIRFERSVFGGDVDFSQLQFPGPVLFDHASFAGAANFGMTTFAEHADFDHVTFRDRANFRAAVFDDHAGFEGAVFCASATFIAAEFGSYLDLADAHFAQDVAIEGAKFQTARQLGPFTVAGKLSLDASQFGARVMIDAGAGVLSAQDTVFSDGVRLSLSDARVDLERADLGRASALAGRDSGSAPTLLTLCSARVAGLSISNVDLRECRFFGAHGLETLSIEPSCQWLHTPQGLGCIDREMIAEEDDWRLRDERRRDGRRLRVRRPRIRWDDGDPSRNREQARGEALDLGQLAGVYRALRKASEDSNDQAGAADLYYGEMEMRRRNPMPGKRGRPRAWGDKLIIGGYWLLAGYGLRASRSFLALAAIILIAAVLLSRWGFQHRRPYADSVLFGAQSSLTLVRPLETPATRLLQPGEVIQIALRLCGPALLALGVLSVRSRIKR
jgi:hypothetical protein